MQLPMAACTEAGKGIAHAALAGLKSCTSRTANRPVVALPSVPRPLRRSVRLVASAPRGDGGTRNVGRAMNRVGLVLKDVDWRVRYTAGLCARTRNAWVMVRAGLTGWCRPLR